MNSRARMAMLLLLWVGLAGLSQGLRTRHRELLPERPMVRFEDVLLDLMGEGRTVMARYLWFKMDLIHEQLDDDGVPTFHQKQVVPLLRMITFLDPYLVDAYDTLAYELHRGYQRTDEALQLVSEGLKFSPQSFELHFRKGLLLKDRKDWKGVLEEGLLAVKSAQDEFQQKNGLRLLYHSAVHLNNPRLGVQVVDEIRGAAEPPPIYREQYYRWKKELGQ